MDKHFVATIMKYSMKFHHLHRGLGIDLGLQGPINKKRILEQSQVIFRNKTTGLFMEIFINVLIS